MKRNLFNAAGKVFLGIICALSMGLLPLSSAQAFDKCGTVDVSTPGLAKLCGTTGGIYGLLGGTINFLTGIIGGLAVLAIIFSGIQYITSQGNPDALKKAKSRLTNAVVGLVLLSLTRIILQFLGVAK